MYPLGCSALCWKCAGCCKPSLAPDAVPVRIVGGFVEQGKTSETEYYYGAKYGTEGMPGAWRQRWAAPQQQPQLHLPLLNTLISTEFELQQVILIQIDFEVRN